MTYAMGASLQAAIFARLSGDAAIDAEVHGAIYDAVPEAAPDLFVAIGPERVTGRSDVSGAGAIHELQINVVTRRNGYSAAKVVAALVSNALDGTTLPLSRGHLVSMRFQRARARRDEGETTRRIDLWFRARLDDRSV